MAPSCAGSRWRLIIGSEDPPQSSSSETPGADTWMQACDRPPSAKAFPEPRNRTVTGIRPSVEARPASRDLAELHGAPLAPRASRGLRDAQGLERVPRRAQVRRVALCEFEEVRELGLVRVGEADEE